MSSKKSEKMVIRHFEPVKIKEELFGKRIEFNHSKRYIKFISLYHDPGFIHYDQIEKMTILYDKRKVLLWLGIATLFLLIGIFLIIIRIALPPWKITLRLKKEQKDIVIRARFSKEEGSKLAEFCTKEFPVILIIPKI